MGALLEPWAVTKGMVTAWIGNDFALAIYVKTGEEKDNVINAIIEQLK